MKSLADQAITWQNGKIRLLDQRKLPSEIQFVECISAAEVSTAIKEMVVRGAPAIGVTAAYGVVLAAKSCYAESSDAWKQCIEDQLHILNQARPTAVNLKWAISRMRDVITTIRKENPVDILLHAAKEIHQQDIQTNKALGKNGATLIKNNSNVLTHCNTGALATGGYGTALGVIRCAYAQNKIKSIYADETRPWFQGTRLTAWELLQDNIPVTLICDSAAASLMLQKELTWVIVGADRIASNGDVVNKIGTYSLAVMAQQHGVKFMVAAPTSTIDLQVTAGEEIEIEVRTAAEVTQYGEHSFAPDKAQVWNPVFDVTPARFITALVTEKGIIEQPNRSKIEALMQSQEF